MSAWKLTSEEVASIVAEEYKRPLIRSNPADDELWELLVALDQPQPRRSSRWIDVVDRALKPAYVVALALCFLSLGWLMLTGTTFWPLMVSLVADVLLLSTTLVAVFFPVRR